MTVVVATLEAVLSGTAIATGPVGHCVRCSTTVREGDAVGLSASQTADHRWQISRLYCTSCRPECLSASTRGVHKAIVHARAGTITDVTTQRSWLVCLDPTCVTIAGVNTETATTRSQRPPRHTQASALSQTPPSE